jgi:hypothetical protein
MTLTRVSVLEGIDRPHEQPTTPKGVRAPACATVTQKAPAAATPPHMEQRIPRGAAESSARALVSGRIGR